MNKKTKIRQFSKSFSQNATHVSLFISQWPESWHVKNTSCMKNWKRFLIVALFDNQIKQWLFCYRRSLNRYGESYRSLLFFWEESQNQLKDLLGSFMLWPQCIWHVLKIPMLPSTKHHTILNKTRVRIRLLKWNKDIICKAIVNKILYSIIYDED